LKKKGAKCPECKSKIIKMSTKKNCLDKNLYCDKRKSLVLMESSFDLRIEDKKSLPRVDSNPYFRNKSSFPRGDAQQYLARYKGDFKSYIEKKAKPNH
jgi:hypothetical protein